MNNRKLIMWTWDLGFAKGLMLCFSLLQVLGIHGEEVQEPLFQDNVLSFTQYSYEDGLLFNPNTAIFQDLAGYMWFGSRQGFCRYDGYHFQWFGSQSQDDPISSPLWVTSFFEDDRERLWIGSLQGLFCLDRWRENVELFLYDPNNPQSISSNEVHCLSPGLNNTLWVGTSNGLNQLDLTTHTFQHFLFNPDLHPVTPFTSISALYLDDRGNLWFGSNNILYRLDPTLAHFSEIAPPVDLGKLYYPIFAILPSASGKLWIAKYKDGTLLLDPETLQFSQYKCKSEDPYETHRSLYEDPGGILWIATDSGLLRLNPQTGTWARETYHRERINGLSSNGVMSVSGDRSGSVWVTTNKQLNHYDSSRFPFRMIKHDPNDANSLGANSVFAICEDAQGMIWIGLEDQGLNRYDPKTQTYTQYRHDPNDPTSLSSNTVTALCPDSNGLIWVGAYLQGVCLLDPQTGRCQRFPFNKDARDPVNGSGLNNDIVREIRVARDEKVWIGTENGGVNVYDPQTEKFAYFQCDPQRTDTLCSNDVRSILEDRRGTIWVANSDFGSAGGAGGYSKGGLNRFIPETQTFRQYPCVEILSDPKRQLYGNRVHDLLEDRQGRFWLGTNEGLVEFDREQEIFSYPTPQQGLRGRDFRSLVESEDGYLWMGTGYSGVFRYHLATHEFTQYDITDGMEELGYRINVGLKAHDGTLYFGCSEGLAVVDRGRVLTNRYAPPTRIQQIQVLDSVIPLSQMGDGFSLHLPYWKNVLSFEFSALNFTQAKDNQFAYRLEGLEQEWVQSGDRRFARYSKIPPGYYRFCVKGGNNQRVWGQEGDAIQIIIDPPLWMRWWFRLSIVCLVLVSCAVGYYLQVRHIRADNQRLEKEVRDRTAQICANRDYLLHIIHTSPVVILGFLEDGTLTFINPAGERTFNVTADQLQGCAWWNIATDEGERERIEWIHQRIVNNEFHEQEIPLTFPSGRIRTILWSFVNRVDEKGDRIEILAFANDITERLENEILEISGREQRKIGREIHDSLCQTLTGLTFMCSGLLSQKDALPPSQSEMIAKIKEHLHNVTMQSKQLARGLYLHELENRGLVPALKELTTTVQSLFNVQCEFSAEGTIAIDNLELSTHLYRIAQEALSNAVKHSQANRITLKIWGEDRQVTLSIRDNGTGFIFQDDISKRGMGLGIMINRARMINASLTIDTHPGNGTDIRCLLRMVS